MFVVVLLVRLFPIVIEFPPGTINSLYAFSWISLIALSCDVLAVAYVSFKVLNCVSTAATSVDEVPVPLYRSTSGVVGGGVEVEPDVEVVVELEVELEVEVELELEVEVE